MCNLIVRHTAPAAQRFILSIIAVVYHGGTLLFISTSHLSNYQSNFAHDNDASHPFVLVRYSASGALFEMLDLVQTCVYFNSRVI